MMQSIESLQESLFSAHLLCLQIYYFLRLFLPIHAIRAIFEYVLLLPLRLADTRKLLDSLIKNVSLILLFRYRRTVAAVEWSLLSQGR